MRRSVPLAPLTIATLLSLLVAACSSGNGGGGTTQPVEVAEIQVSPSSLELTEGEQEQLVALAFDGQGRQVTGVAVAFSSQAPSVVSSTPGGLVSALGDGDGIVRASAGSVHADVPVTVIGPPALSATQVEIPARPFGAAISPAGLALVTQQDANSLTPVNTSSLEAGSTIPVGIDPGDVIFTASGSRAYATNYIEGTISVIDVASRSVVKTYEGSGGSPTHSVLSADESRLYVTTIDGWLNVYTTSNGALLTSKAIRSGLNGLARHGDRLYIGSTDGYVFEVALPGLAVLRTFTLGGRPQEVAVTSDGAEIFVADEHGTVRVIDRVTGSAVAIEIGAGGFGLALAPGERYVYVSQPSAGTVAIVHRKRRLAVASIPVGGTPRRIAVHTPSETILVANEGGWADIIR